MAHPHILLMTGGNVMFLTVDLIRLPCVHVGEIDAIDDQRDVMPSKFP